MMTSRRRTPLVLDETEFYALVQRAVDDIPARYKERLENVAFMVEDAPTLAQRRSGGILHRNQTLLGLYEGVSLPNRAFGYSGMVPDVITVFRLPHLQAVDNFEDLAALVHQTVWHEVAHYFGLDHGQINALQSNK